MSLVSFNNVTNEFGGVRVLKDVSFELADEGKVGLVGENGSGKTTLLNLIAGALKPDSGVVHVARSAGVCYVPQTPELRSDRTAYEEVLAARPSLFATRRKMLSLEPEIANERAAASYAEVVAEYSASRGYEFERKTREALVSLGLGEEQIGLSLNRLSGGERGRVALAKALLANPTLLLLDEPDNHLDIEGIRWLEGVLKRYPGAFVLVTHDRELLDRAVDSIVEIEDAKVTVERGGYADFLKRKQKKLEAQKRQYLEQQRRVRKLKEAVNRAEGKGRGIERRTIHFHYRKRAAKVARRAVVIKRRIERQLEDEMRVEKPRTERDRVRVDLAPPKWHAATVLRMEGVAKSFGDRPLLADVSVELSRGQRIAIVGPNGCGKTTLMEIALGIQPADDGDVWLSEGASVFYCDQKQAGLKPELSVYESVAEETDLNHNQTHYLLAKLLFKGEAVGKKVAVLSGGERTRLVLALLMNTRADVLMLDEPSSHLDLPSIEVLEEALRSFAGAVMFISHDRRFVNAVATDAYELRDQRLKRRDQPLV